MASDDKLKRPLKGENAVDTRQSPPKAIVDCSPLQPAISKNKEGTSRLIIIDKINRWRMKSELFNYIIIQYFSALKIKLMVRRPIAQLVDQGIIPCKFFFNI